MITLSELPRRCFQGEIPALIATCAGDGTPNATWLSQVYLVDGSHVALSCQFFRKTRENLAANPRARALLMDPETLQQWSLSVRLVRSETSGPTFDAMKQRIEAVAALTGMAEVFALKSAEVFEVLSIEAVPIELSPESGVAEAAPAFPPSLSPAAALSGLTGIATGICSELGPSVERGLEILTQALGYEAVTLYLLEGSEGLLYALASRGFSHSGVGATIPLGHGLIGMAGQERRAIFVQDVTREELYARAVVQQVERVRGAGERDIQLPGLEHPGSLLAVPLLVGGELFGVLAAESLRPHAFTAQDEEVLTIAGHLLAQRVALQSDEESAAGPDPASDPPPRAVTRVRYYEADDSVFVDDQYLIKGLPGRILWLLLTLRESEGRSTFSNRELRLHPFLKLHGFKDNLETRLLVLQRRLADKEMAFRITREVRGRLTLRTETELRLEKV